MRLSRRGRVALALAGVGVGAAAALAPLALRQIPFFRIRRIEVRGVRLLPPERVIEALGLTPTQNLFAPLAESAARVRALEGVERVRLDRRVPATLRVTVIERPPAALVSTPEGMMALDCAGRALPYDLAGAAWSLPIVARPDTVLARALCAVRLGDSALYDAVDLARAGPGGAVILDLGERRVRLQGVPTTDEVRAVGLVRRHLLATGRAFAELDARFAGRVYARRDRS